MQPFFSKNYNFLVFCLGKGVNFSEIIMRFCHGKPEISGVYVNNNVILIYFMIFKSFFDSMYTNSLFWIDYL